MAKRYQTFFFNPTGGTGYVSDTGSVHALKAKFVIPPDMSDAVANNIVVAVGGTVTDTPIPCPDAGNFKPRKLVFIRQDTAGTVLNSIEVAVPDRALLVAYATAIRDTLNGLGGGQVVCIKLKGEEWKNRYDELAPIGKAITPGVSSRPTTGISQPVYAGSIAYFSDVSFGLEKTVPIKALTDGVGLAPPVVAQIWNDCVGPFVSRGACPGRERRNHRRWLLSSLVTQNGEDIVQKLEVPNFSHTNTDVQDCGTALAAVPSTLCLGYIGESYDRVHLLLA